MDTTRKRPSAPSNPTSDSGDVSKPSDRSAESLILELARSLHASGAPAYELDQRMEEVASSLGKPAKFFSTPTALFVTFDGDSGSTRLLRVMSGDTNLGLYASLFDLQQEIHDGKVNQTEAWDRLTNIQARPVSYPWYLQLLAFGIVGGCVGILVGGNPVMIFASGGLGWLVGCITLGLTARDYPMHLINVIAGFVAGTIACLIQAWGVPSHFELISLSALIILVPGLQLTISINELATQNLASGSARIAGALTSLLTLVFGVYMGFGMVDAIVHVPPSVQPHVPGMLISVAMTIPLGLCFAVLFRTRHREIGWVVASSLIAVTTLRLAGELLSPFAAVWIASVIAGLTSRHFAREGRLPAAVMLMPAMILLVPGSLGFAGLSQIMLSENLPSGIRLLATMMLTAGSIVAGLLLSDVLLPTRPKRTSTGAN